MSPPPRNFIRFCTLQKIQQKQTSAILGGSPGYPSLQAMVLSEVSSRQHTNSNSATVALRWLKRWVQERCPWACSCDVVFGSSGGGLAHMM